ncbi:hypothetical protein [Streptomyces sp. NPDC057438]|uniref:hypothetical protein n=1 Tax=Streptomyces sp. NPDC057438 TaxID=3346133 RepID=UPI0036C0BA07
MVGTLDPVRRGLTGLETGEETLWLDPVPVPELSAYGFVRVLHPCGRVRRRGPWGVRLRLRTGPLRNNVRESDRAPIIAARAYRTFSVRPGESRRLALPGWGRC